MAFASNKSGEEKKSPLAGWLGKKKPQEVEDDFPEVNVEAGLTRALRGVKAHQEQKISVHEQVKPIREALTSIESALYAIDRLRDILEQACDIAVSAKDADDIGARALLAESYDDLRMSIETSIKKIDPSAALLIGKNQRHVDVNLGGKTRYSISPIRLDTSEKGLHLIPPRNAFEASDEVDAVLDHLDKALHKADKAAGNYCRDAQYLIARMNATIAAAGEEAAA